MREAVRVQAIELLQVAARAIREVTADAGEHHRRCTPGPPLEVPRPWRLGLSLLPDEQAAILGIDLLFLSRARDHDRHVLRAELDNAVAVFVDAVDSQIDPLAGTELDRHAPATIGF